MVLTSLPLLDLPVDDAVRSLLLAAHRSNDQVLFESGLLDHDLAARALTTPDFDNVVLKVAFLSLPLARLVGWEGRAHEGLTGKILDFADERTAAGRPIWEDGLQLAARTPMPGVRERVLADLEHLDVERRRAAVRAALRLGHEPAVAAALERRRASESDPGLRDLLAPRAPTR